MTGDERTFSLAHRITNGLIVVVGLASLFGAAANAVLGVPWWATVTAAVTAMGHVGLFVWSRYGRAYPAPGVISYLTMVMVVYPLTWTYNFGLDGGIQLTGIALLVVAVVTFEGRQRWLAVLFT
ncbi:MAG: hypothetical protein AAGA56_27275, partial [Myxococcota bacterium]